MNNNETQACDVMDNLFRVIIMFLRMAGVQISMKKGSILSSIYNVLTAVNGYALYIGMCVVICINNDDLKNFIKTFRVVNSSSIIYWLHFNISWRLRDFERLLRLTESFTWEDQPTRDPHTGHRTFAGWIPHIQKVLKYAYAFTTLIHLVQSGVRIYASHDLIFSATYPFDTVSSPGYELVIVMQIFASNFYMGIVFGSQLLYATLVMVACSQLQKLRTNLLGIKQELVPTGADFGSDGGEEPVSSSEGGFCRMQTQLNECVRHHQAILQYVITFTVHSWGDIIDLTQILIIYAVAISYVCLFCALGTELTLQAERVRDAAWGCDWVGTPVPFQRCLAFIIATANKEFTLTAGKFVPVTNSTMMNILKESISLFMFLLTMKDKSEEAVTGYPIHHERQE
ncbi:uncharacterized protein LOC111869608 isoform X2 [Cryptotermes secundus]|uniref:uncharacterized protein LOC111869608 isoform X2 n=1 Tax=Cryptotermes secundus TaxID=105785 RepID=UPI001454D434|nr:uncharacterized protein LOC111869608 isoform X2 [Cryptotermes secundus]